MKLPKRKQKVSPRGVTGSAWAGEQASRNAEGQSTVGHQLSPNEVTPQPYVHRNLWQTTTPKAHDNPSQPEHEDYGVAGVMG